MTVEQAVAALLGSGVGAAGVIGLLLWFVWPYVRRKVENVATKQDIGEITTTVETIKKDLQLEIEGRKADHQLMFVAAEKRLEAHQEAYYLAVKLRSKNVRDEAALGEHYEKMKKFYLEKCLFLDPKVRSVFVDAMNAAPSLPIVFAKSPTEIESNFGPEQVKRLRTEMNETIRQLPRIIEDACHLPSLKPNDTAPISQLVNRKHPAAE